MTHRQSTLLQVLLLSLAFAATGAEIDFNRQVRPILAANCLACHGPDEAAREANLRLDTFAGATADLDGTRALVPGDPNTSELIARIETNDPDDVMPPPDSGHELTTAQKTILRQWVAAGGTYSEHWSFVPPKRPNVPEVPNRKWVQNPIDAFVAAKLADSGLTPSPEADKATLLRRVSLDLTGLPPSPAQLDAFVADTSPTAYQTVVNRLLASPAFGERWARVWLDLARYADTRGYEKDKHRDVWRYRDWVIDAFNADLPYDQFTRDQLAGDLLPDHTPDQLLATAFHRNTMTNEEGGTDNEEFRVAAVKDRVDTTVQVWMGLTMGCAKCHTHKYDPISLRDYYAFYALFNQTADNDQEHPIRPTPTREQLNKQTQLEQQLNTARTALTDKQSTLSPEFEAWRRDKGYVDVWTRLKMTAYHSKAGTTLAQDDQLRIIATGKRPATDTWRIDLSLPDTATDGYQALRIDHFPKSVAGGAWPDENFVIHELTAVHVVGDTRTPVTLKNPRASFSQKSWSIAGSIDGKPKTGWAISPNYNDHQVAVYDFDRPLAGGTLELTLEQNYGRSLLLSRSAFAVSNLPPASLQPDRQIDLQTLYANNHDPAVAKLRQEIKSLDKALADHRRRFPQTLVMLELSPDKQRQTRIHTRGNFLDQGETVEPAVLSRFGSLPADAPTNRLGVAEWLTSPDNPLTARVMANRLWARLFGTGLVETEEDFGMQGMMPSHPQLLDWLAVEFRANGWSVKQLLRTIVLSGTYRQSNVVQPTLADADPRNRLLARGARVRLSAETIRDQALFASGLLTDRIGGPSVMPPQPPGVWKSTYNGGKWQNATGPDRYRRALYTYLKRTSPYPSMTTFDAGSGETCLIRRVRTNTPLQALVTLNDVVYLEAAGALAKRMTTAGDSIEAQLRHGWRLVLLRNPRPDELARLLTLYQTIGDQLANGTEFAKFADAPEVDPRLIAVANTLLNLDEALMKP